MHVLRTRAAGESTQRGLLEIEKRIQRGKKVTGHHIKRLNIKTLRSYAITDCNLKREINWDSL